jgi:hypothetical protein
MNTFILNAAKGEKCDILHTFLGDFERYVKLIAAIGFIILNIL